MLSLPFELAYFFGYTPWDRWGNKPLPRLREFFEGPDALPPSRALDVGCGRGRSAIYLAQQGWTVTGVDAVERALRVARRRAAQNGVEVELVHGDVAHLDRSGITGPFDLFLDLGCFHILPDQVRALYGASLARAAAPDARLILFAFGHNKHPFGPRGAERDEIERYLSPAWNITWSAPEHDLPYRTPRGASATWYVLRRSSLTPGATQPRT